MPPKRSRRSTAAASATKAAKEPSSKEYDSDPSSDGDVSMMDNSSPIKGKGSSKESSTKKSSARGLARQNTNGSTNKSKRNVNGKRTRETDEDHDPEDAAPGLSDEDVPDASNKGSQKVNGTGTAWKNPSGKRPYVQVRRISELSQMSSASGRSTPRSSRRTTLSRRNTSTPGTSEPSHTSDGDILTDDGSLQFEDNMTSSSSSGSEFEDDSVDGGSDIDIDAIQLSDSELESVIMNSARSKKLKNGKITPSQAKAQGSKLSNALKAAAQRAKSDKAKILDLGEAEDTEDEMVKAAVKASLVSAAKERKSSMATSGAGSSFSRVARTSLSGPPRRKNTRQSGTLDSDTSDEPLALKTGAKSKNKSKGKGRVNGNAGVISVSSSDSDDIEYKGNEAGDVMDLCDDDSLLSEDDGWLLELNQQIEKDKKEKAILRKEEQAEKKRLGRKLTYAEKATISLYLYHPELRTCWGDLEKREIIQPERGVQPPELKAKLLPFQLESLTWMRKQENGVWGGGMLADEMGMGKTIQTLALLVSDRRRPNLVVAPTVAIMQWRNEIEQHTTGFNVNLFHGASRTKDPETLKKCDVVLTTYSVLESVYRKQMYGFKRKGQLVKERSILHDITWARVILDEAHNIKERSTSTAKAAFELEAKYRWCLSGTPLQNRVGELYSLVRFLGGDPFSYYFCKKCDCKSLTWKFTDKRTCDKCQHPPSVVCLWNNEILGPIQKHGFAGPGQDAFRKLRILLERAMLRRTKLERADDLGLPPRTVIVRRDYFSPEEKELYLSLFSDAKRTFSTYVDSGTVLNNYSNIFTLITRMRQMACHPDLVLKSKKNMEFAADVVETAVCRLCNEIAEDAIESKCHHIFDRECIRQYVEASIGIKPECPVCHLPLSIDLEAEAIEISGESVNKARQGILGRLDLDEWRSSSKIEALVEELSSLRNQDRTVKSLVFSQFVNFLDLIAFRLKRAGFNICRLEGTMTPQARDLTIKHFMNNVDVTVFLVSLKAGGVALNLTEASRVYLMDSWWNPAVEFQAMDRIHRLGQHRPVQAIKLVIEDSIESRIVQLQEKKSAMVEATLSTDDSAMGRLTPEDLSFLFRL
ncbi:DNA repair protein rad16 [Serendipita sp. 411]|nr:DNA repair protein rad16 [Serendipita sp. 398]KAG8849828.1 DNA repair protein rad16 [Serendipita sp. 411]KAG9055163.1 DNA repair protein rad16 [Serendipita sp. 407]